MSKDNGSEDSVVEDLKSTLLGYAIPIRSSIDGCAGGCKVNNHAKNSSAEGERAISCDFA